MCKVKQSVECANVCQGGVWIVWWVLGLYFVPNTVTLSPLNVNEIVIVNNY